MCEYSNTVNEYKAGQQLAAKLIDALGLPKHCTRVEIIFTANERPVVRVEAYHEAQAIELALLPKLLEFKLVPNLPEVDVSNVEHDHL